MASRTRSTSSRRSLSQSSASPASPLVQASIRKHRYDDDDDYSTDSDYSDDLEDDRGRGRMQSSTGSSGSSMIILVLVLLLCAAGVAAVYFWNENRKNGSSPTTPSVTTQTVTTEAGTTNPVTGSNSAKPTKTSDGGGGDDDEEGEPSPSKPTSRPTSSNSAEDSSKPSSKPAPSKSSDSPSPTKSDSPEASPTDSPPSDSNPSSSIVSPELLDVLLKTHNDFRKIHQVDPLEWNETLAEASEEWVKNCVWEHSGGKLLEGGYGENLFGSSSTSYTETSPPVDGKAGVDAWNSEISMYTYDPPTGFTHETGHVTQTLWKGTKSVGCQFRNCKGLFESDQWGAYLVCQYYPPGNYEGAYKENVLPPLE